MAWVTFTRDVQYDLATDTINADTIYDDLDEASERENGSFDDSRGSEFSIVEVRGTIIRIRASAEYQILDEAEDDDDDDVENVETTDDEQPDLSGSSVLTFGADDIRCFNCGQPLTHTPAPDSVNLDEFMCRSCKPPVPTT